jgi:hypothetical protein
MELSTKVKELEDELKVLKAEIRNVLLDIREVILDGTNPLAEHQEPAYLRMDLNTTARALAAEEATRAAREAVEQVRGEEHKEDKAEKPEASVAADLSPKEEAAEQAAGEENMEGKPEEPEASLSADLFPEEEAAEQAAGEEDTEDNLEEPEPEGNGGLPRKGKAPPDASPLEPAAIPPLHLAYLLPTGATGGLAAWVTEAMAVIGPQDLERVITIHRLWGSLPPNISYALAHLQRLIRSSREAEPAWLKVMQDMEKLASS